MVSDIDYSLLSANFGLVHAKKVQQTTTKFQDNFWYNPPYINGKVFVDYATVDSNTAISPLNNPGSLTEFGYINFVLSQHNVQVNRKVKRNAIAGTFLLIGAFISMLTRITNLTIGG
jgi:hypothetical protein